MNQMDVVVEPTGMKHVFTTKPDLTPFVVLPNQVPRDELNSDLASLDGIRKVWALASMNMDFSVPDTADSELLNRTIWYPTKGFDRPYPGDERVLAPDEVHTYLKAQAERAAVEAKGPSDINLGKSGQWKSPIPLRRCEVA